MSTIIKCYLDLFLVVNSNIFLVRFLYSKYSKNWDTYKNYSNFPQNGVTRFYNAEMHPTDVAGMENSVDPNKTAPYKGAV